MGNTEPGDGWKFHGRVYVQLTGRDAYERIGKEIGQDLVHQQELAENREVAAKIAIQYWQDRVVPHHHQTDVTGACHDINGGENGLKERKAAAAWDENLTHGYPLKNKANIGRDPIAQNHFRKQFSMKYIHHLGLLTLCSLGIACTASEADASNSSSATSAYAIKVSTQAQAAAAKTAQLKSPANFTSYASESIGENIECHVGAVTGDDGMNQKPVAYAENAKDKKILWVKQLDVPPNTFQSRATHCTSSGDKAYVLLQSDTQSEQTLSQTLLRVVKLNAHTGAVIAQQNVDVPKAYSAWVEEGATHFQWKGDALLVTGNYRLSSDNDSQAQFAMHLNSDLKP